MELFKYMPYRPEFFTTLLLRFTPASEFNDPFEGQPKMSSLEKAAHIAKILINGNWEPVPNDLYMQNIAEQREIQTDAGLGILSLTRSKHSLLMWAHYANKHEGIIIGFDTEDPFFNQNISPKRNPPEDTSYLGKVFPVFYDRIKLDFEFGPIEKSLLHKSDEWIYEKEYRMFMRREDCNEFGTDADGNKMENVNLFKVPACAITRIIMGKRANKEAIKLDFKNASKDNPRLSHIKIETAELHGELYHIEHIPVNLL